MEPSTQRWNTLWSVQRSIRYHARREAFFERWHRLTSGLSLLFATAAVADLLRGAGHWGAVAAALVIAVLSAADLVVGTAQMARTHADLRRRFIDLECSIQLLPLPDHATADGWAAERLRIERDEPPIYVALDLLCENEQATATSIERRYSLTWWQRCTAHWLHWDNLVPLESAVR